MPYVIGIGSSAGGLEALLEFFSQFPSGIGVSFVVIQHLDPTHKDMLAELLQRVTPLKAVQACQNMKVLPNYIYVIPPNKDISILNGKFILLEPVAKRGLRLPIDFFFHSLAGLEKEQAIGIVLSGMGSDGTVGARAIKEHSGLILVQNPDAAKFDAMPSSVIKAGLADIIAPADELYNATTF